MPPKLRGQGLLLVARRGRPPPGRAPHPIKGGKPRRHAGAGAHPPDSATSARATRAARRAPTKRAGGGP
eukprot:4225148-Lingulodinium_polyedra.AAC.1